MSLISWRSGGCQQSDGSPRCSCLARQCAVGRRSDCSAPPQLDGPRPLRASRQGYDHELGRSAGVFGAGAKPPSQGAVLLEHEKSARQLHHTASNTGIARTGQSILPAAAGARCPVRYRQPPNSTSSFQSRRSAS
jgi:hypothetical protein